MFFIDGFNGHNQIKMHLQYVEKVAFKTPMRNLHLYSCSHLKMLEQLVNEQLFVSFKICYMIAWKIILMILL